MHHQEVRGALLKLTDVERRKAVANAIASGDESFLAAAVSGAPMLCGWTAAEKAAAKERWRTERYPDTAATIARLRAGLAQLERLAPMFRKWSDQLVAEPDAKVVAAAEATQVRAREAAG
jgi:hypothetical protein